MRYEILGPLRILDGGTPSSISAKKVEVLLAALVVRAEHLVTSGQLIKEIWPERPPRRATASLYVHISQLRKFLHRPERPQNPIVTQAPGYVLRLGADQTDLHDFQQLSGEGREHLRAGHYQEAVHCLESALALWRGPALGDLRDGPIIGSFATWLEESQVECIEMCIEAGLTLGQHREMVGRLFSLTTEYPLREAFYRQLMLALYRSERQADALAVYRTARETLQEQLGLEPGRALRELQRAILADDDRLIVWDRRRSAHQALRPGSPHSAVYGSTSLIA